MTHTPDDAPVRQEASPYNAAYLADDRSDLADRYGLDPALGAGRVDPDRDRRVAPPDLSTRREAVLEWYGHRCGRCARPLAARDPRAEESLGYAVSVGRARDADRPWALDELVAVCTPCYDLLEPAEPAAVGTIATRFHEAPQFPAWLCDPRVAVERAPLTGRELFRREHLARALPERFDFGVNRPVAERAVLAVSTPASRAVALSEALLASRRAPPGEAPADPERAWTALSPARRRRYERRTLTARSVAESGRPWRERWTVALEGGGGEAAPTSP